MIDLEARALREDAHPLGARDQEVARGIQVVPMLAVLPEGLAGGHGDPDQDPAVRSQAIRGLLEAGHRIGQVLEDMVHHDQVERPLDLGEVDAANLEPGFGDLREAVRIDPEEIREAPALHPAKQPAGAAPNIDDAGVESDSGGPAPGEKGIAPGLLLRLPGGEGPATEEPPRGKLLEEIGSLGAFRRGLQRVVVLGIEDPQIRRNLDDLQALAVRALPVLEDLAGAQLHFPGREHRKVPGEPAGTAREVHGRWRGGIPQRRVERA